MMNARERRSIPLKRIVALLLCFALCLTIPLSSLAELSYLIADSDSRKLTEDELWQWDYESLGYILNEIFARHGYNFIPGEKYDYYFRCMPWYTPNADPDNQAACYPKLNSVEWYNEQQVKAVRRQMRESGNYNLGGKSVWDYFSSGFDTLQGFEYIQLKAGQKLPVYSAPSRSSWQGANGKAKVSTNGNVWAAGWENGWMLIMYETNNGSVRVGYVDAGDIRGDIPENRRLTYEYQPATVHTRCTLTDDPARTNSAIVILQPGQTVTYLSSYFNSCPWDYVETIAEGKTVRGFVPAGCLDISGQTDAIGK
ncbi:MAG: YARHG domain-containing protein [Clostridia bacterium]|nr:YARHG domain-containing protein [Clostridia bacterium]